MIMYLKFMTDLNNMLIIIKFQVKTSNKIKDLLKVSAINEKKETLSNSSKMFLNLAV